MLWFLPRPIKGVVSSIILILNTLFWSVFIYFFVIIKILSPIKSLRDWASKQMVAAGENWIGMNSFEARLMHKIEWDVEGVDPLDPNKSYLVCSNHRSWVDIVALQTVFNRKIPFLRFFLKRDLLYVPFLGIAWWALDFPFMRRYSKEYLAKHPEMRGRDLATTRKACERFKGQPISILNFLEGTRFTQAKHDKMKSPFHHLLTPKTGGLAFVLQTMGSQFDALLDVTLYYPEGSPTLWKLLKWSGE